MILSLKVRFVTQICEQSGFSRKNGENGDEMQKNGFQNVCIYI